MNQLLVTEEASTFNEIYCPCGQTISEECFKKSNPDLYGIVVQKINGKKTVPLNQKCQNPGCENKAVYQNEKCKHWLCNKCIEANLQQVVENNGNLENTACFCGEQMSLAYLQSTFPALVKKMEGEEFKCLDCGDKTNLKNQICGCTYCPSCIKK